MKIADTTKIAEISAKKLYPEYVNDGKHLLDFEVCFYRSNDGCLYWCNKGVHFPKLKKADRDMVERFERA